MKRGFLTLVTIAASLGALATLSSPAQASQVWANTQVAVGSPASSTQARFGASPGSTAAAFNTANPSIVIPVGTQNPAIANIIQMQAAPGTAAGQIVIATIEFRWENGHTGADFREGPKPYDVVLQLGDINIGTGGSLILNEIRLIQETTLAVSVLPINMALTATDSDAILKFDMDDVLNPDANRLHIRQAQVSFSFTPGTGTTTFFGVQALASPEPGTLALFGLGMLGLVGTVRRRRKRRALADA